MEIFILFKYKMLYKGYIIKYSKNYNGLSSQSVLRLTLMYTAQAVLSWTSHLYPHILNSCDNNLYTMGY